ncbi:MAG: NUDIX hydrolase [bacterium]|nr:NUDIX hydrolase [bacterium]
MSSPTNIAQKAILIREDGNILALRRSNTDPSRPLTWDLPGGEVEFGEDLLNSIKREIREEVGFNVETLSLLDCLAWVNPRGEYWVAVGYFAKVPSGTKVTLSFEHSEFEWISKEEFLTRESTFRIKRFLEKLPPMTT